MEENGIKLNLSSRVKNGLEAEVNQGMTDINQEFKEREVQNQANELGLPYIYLLETPINPDVLSTVPKEISIMGDLIPFHQIGKKLNIAISNKNNSKLKEIIKILEQKYEISLYFCSQESLKFAQRNYDQKTTRVEEEVTAKVDEEKKVDFEEEIQNTQKMAEKMDGAKTDVSLNILHEVVIKLGVSDIHFQPMEKETIIRARVHGLLRKIMTISHKIAEGLVMQIKHDAKLKYNITRIPQDGKYAFVVNDRKVDVRVSTLPTSYGESVVLRFLDSKKGIVPLEKLGFLPRLQKEIEKAIFSTGGMILVTGPTGSGKTTTLYSSIAKINTPDKKIVTLEDPVEFRLPGVLQAGVDEQAGFTFSSGLRSLLRQDPDVVLIGEIRDKETAEAAIQAALTGHVVFSTLHTNSSADTIARLMNMGIAAFVLAPALRMIMAQRLVRKICSECVEEVEPTKEENGYLNETIQRLQSLGIEMKIPNLIKKGRGCQKCGNSGYFGETAILETLKITPEIQDTMYNDFSANTIRKISVKNNLLMWEEGVIKVINGETTFDELKRKIEKF